MEQENRASWLIDRIYEASVGAELWQVFVREFSEVFGDAAVVLGLQLPMPKATLLSFRVHLSEDYAGAFRKHLIEGSMPWGSLVQPVFCDGFARASDIYPDADLPASIFYQEWMQPQGLAPKGPLAHTIWEENGQPIAGVAVYRRVGGRRFDGDDIDLANSLVPHLNRAFRLGLRFGAMRARRNALAEVIDRLPIGVILLDAAQNTLVTNHCADRIAGLEDGFQLTENGPRAEDPRDHAGLRNTFQQVSMGMTGLNAGNVCSISRPSGRPSFGVLVSALLEEFRNPGDAAYVMFIGDPDADQFSTCTTLQSLFSLTHAEAELVRLIARGRSLDEAAAERGVTRNTARTQLKQIFAKTGARRQGDLVRLVLSSVAAIGADAPPPGPGRGRNTNLGD